MRAFVLFVLIGSAVGAFLPSRSENAPGPDSFGDGGASAGAVSPTEPLREVTLERRRDGHFYIDGLINGEETRFLIDTGASVIALTVDDAKQIGVAVSPRDFDYVAQGAGGPVRGQAVTLDRVSIGGRVVSNARAMVIEGLHVSLLGQSVLTQLGTVEMTGDRMILR